jgi:hypothetical protein
LCTEPAIAVYIDRGGRPALVHSVNAGDKGACLYVADADGPGFAINTFVANIDVVVASGEKVTGLKAQGNVMGAGDVATTESVKPIGRVRVAGGVTVERLKPIGRVLAAGGVTSKREKPTGRVLAAGGVAKEGIKTIGVLLMPVALLTSAATPVAVLPSPVVLL